MKEGRRIATDFGGLEIGNESLCSLPCLDAACASAAAIRLLWDEEDHDASVARAVADLGLGANLPLAENAQRGFFGCSVLKIGKRDDRDVAFRLRSHVLNESLERHFVLGAEDVREIVDVPGGLRQLELRSLQRQNEPDTLHRAMPHRRVAPSRLARSLASRALGLSLLVATACIPARDASLVVVIDSNRAHEEREVIALPIDPASLQSATSSAATFSRPHADSLSRLVALRDSAVLVDKRYQSERDTLNGESRALDQVDRKSAHYARTFDAFRRRSLAAESLRVTRDRLLDRGARYASRLSAGAALMARDENTLRSSIDTMAAGGRRMVVGQTRNDSIRLLLADGTWWIGVAGGGALPSRWTRVEIPRAGALVVTP